MKEKAISVTEAARNFADCLNQVRFEGMTFVLLKNGTPIARLVPEERKGDSVRKLAAALRKFDLLPEEAKAWRRDLRTAHRILKPAVDKWRD